MRIVSGKLKGRKINAPDKLPTRPTTDMAKEALFNILNNQYYFDELIVLDLFSGIGSISLEFASRGTTDITSVDNFYGCVSFLDKISKELSVDINTIKSDVFKFLKANTKQYDIIFADPPYALEQNKFEEIYDLVLKKQMLKENGLLIIEHSKKTDLSHLENFVKTKKYGSNLFSFFNQ